MPPPPPPPPGDVDDGGSAGGDELGIIAGHSPPAGGDDAGMAGGESGEHDGCSCGDLPPETRGDEGCERLSAGPVAANPLCTIDANDGPLPRRSADASHCSAHSGATSIAIRSDSCSRRRAASSGVIAINSSSIASADRPYSFRSRSDRWRSAARSFASSFLLSRRFAARRSSWSAQALSARAETTFERSSCAR